MRARGSSAQGLLGVSQMSNRAIPHRRKSIGAKWQSRSLYSCFERGSDTYLVVKASNPIRLLYQCPESTVLVDRIDKAPKLYDAIVHRNGNVAFIDPGLRPDALMQRLMQNGVIDLLDRLGNL